jgi:probable HAF family extracellular repeat protein
MTAENPLTPAGSSTRAGRELALKSSKISDLIAALVMFTAAAMPFRLAAQVGNPLEEKQVHYKLVDLGTLGGSFVNPYGGVTNKSWVTGDAALSNNLTEHAFLWRDGVMTDLGTLGGPLSSVGNATKDVRGLVVGISQTLELDPLQEAWIAITGFPLPDYASVGFRWKDGLMSALPTLGGIHAQALGVNNRGQIAGFSENDTHDPNCVPPQQLDFEAVIWGPRGEIQELPPLPGDVIAGALGVNDKGQVVGGSGPICGFLPFPTLYLAHAVLWQDGKPIDLGNFGGAQNNFAAVINNRGQIIGNSDLPGDAIGHGFLWEDGVMTDLGPLPGDYSSSAQDINEQGQVVGISCDVNGNCRGFLWENGVMTDLNTLVPEGFPFPVTAGFGINDRGEIAIQVYDPNTGNLPTYLMIPDTVPAATQLGYNAPSTPDLPDHVRKLLQRRMQLGPFGRGSAAMQGQSTRFDFSALKKGAFFSPLASAQSSTPNATPQSCGLDGARCDASHPCCSFCGPRRWCCSKPLRGESCTSSVQCCTGLCLNHMCQ